MPKISKTPPKPLKIVPKAIVKAPPKPIAKVPPKPVSVKPITPSKLPPKPLATKPLVKTPPKPVNVLPDRLATAADREGLWVKDLVRFPDLLIKHKLPSSVSSEDVEKAHRIHRNKIAETFVKYT